MTKVGNKMVKCAKCEKESEQLIVFSVNFSLGEKEDNEKLLNRKQKCPHCGYEANDISKLEETAKPQEEKELSDTEKRINELEEKLMKYEKAMKNIRLILDSLEETPVKEKRPVIEEYIIDPNRNKFTNSAKVYETDDTAINDRRFISGIHRRHTIGVIPKASLGKLEEHHVIIENNKELDLTTHEVIEDNVIGINISLKMNGALYLFEILKDEETTIRCRIDEVEEIKKLDEKEYKDLVKTLFIIKKKWDEDFNKDIDDEDWSIEIKTHSLIETFEGKGVYPRNWDMFKEFINILLTKFNN